MSHPVQGLHHVTAISGAAQKNLDFYGTGLGLRFVKKTVNFDDPGTYHLYYGNETGAPGTAMTFFPWADAAPGRIGAGQVTVTQFAVPPGALGFWTARLPAHGARLITEEDVFGEARAVFADPDGLLIALVETASDDRIPWTTAEIGVEAAVRGFHGVTLAVQDGGALGALLSEVFGYVPQAEGTIREGTLTRYVSTGSATAGVIDLHVDPNLPAGTSGQGTVHHVAFRVTDSAAQAQMRERMMAAGLQVTEQIDRTYFKAVYARAPGGILFEVATDDPGFDIDEPVESLGASLKLPEQHEWARTRIEALLPALSA